MRRRDLGGYGRPLDGSHGGGLLSCGGGVGGVHDDCCESKSWGLSGVFVFGSERLPGDGQATLKEGVSVVVDKVLLVSALG